MNDDPDRRPALRSYDEFEGAKKRKRTRLGEREGQRSSADPRKITEEALREAALGYLDRQDASVEQVRRVLKRRIFKYGDEESRGPALEQVEALLERLQASQVLDDERFARGLAESQRRRGASLPKVRQKLRLRGLSDQHQAAALEFLGERQDLGDDASAAIYARKRRLHERYDLSNPKEREKALSALARQGFSFDVARRALEQSS